VLLLLLFLLCCVELNVVVVEQLSKKIKRCRPVSEVGRETVEGH
jgi:hypothetical protein